MRPTRRWWMKRHDAVNYASVTIVLLFMTWPEDLAGAARIGRPQAGMAKDNTETVPLKVGLYIELKNGLAAERVEGAEETGSTRRSGETETNRAGCRRPPAAARMDVNAQTQAACEWEAVCVWAFASISRRALARHVGSPAAS